MPLRLRHTSGSMPLRMPNRTLIPVRIRVLTQALMSMILEFRKEPRMGMAMDSRCRVLP